METETTEQQGGLRLVEDERTGRKRVVTVEEPQEEPPQEEPPQETHEEPQPQETPPQEETPNPITQAVDAMNKATETPPEPKPPEPSETPASNFYRPDEMVLAMQLGNVDEARIPPQFRQQYDALKQKNAPPQPTPEEAEKAVRKRISDMAREEAMKKSGASEDDLALGEFSDDPDVQQRVRDFKVAYDLASQRIIRDSLDRYHEMQAKARAQQEVNNNVRSFIEEQRAKEPNFDKIGQLMSTAYLTMPYQQARIIAPVLDAAQKGTMTQAQANILGQYYEICRKQLYAQINKTSVTPQPVVPKVEKRGTGAPASEPVDYAKMLRDAGARDKSKVLAAWLNAKSKGES